MKQTILSILAVTLTFILGFPIFGQIESHLDSLQIQHSKHKHPFPLKIDSVYLKIRTRDRDIKKIHGEGVFDSADGHLGARYFIDRDGKVILKSTIGVDGFIEEFALTNLAYPFDFVKSIVTLRLPAVCYRLCLVKKDNILYPR